MIVRPEVAIAMMRARCERLLVAEAAHRRAVVALRFATLDMIATLGIVACWIYLRWFA